MAGGSMIAWAKSTVGAATGGARFPSAVAGALAVVLVCAGPLGALAADCGSAPEPGLDWSECSKSNIMLNGSNFQGANLAGADLSVTGLPNSNLDGAQVEKANLMRAWFTGSTMKKANFSRIQAYRRCVLCQRGARARQFFRCQAGWRRLPEGRIGSCQFRQGRADRRQFYACQPVARQSRRNDFARADQLRPGLHVSYQYRGPGPFGGRRVATTAARSRLRRRQDETAEGRDSTSRLALRRRLILRLAQRAAISSRWW
jgi:hypothetical protein